MPKEKHYAVTTDGVLCQILSQKEGQQHYEAYLVRPLFKEHNTFYQLKAYLRRSRVAYTITVKSSK